LYVENSLHFNLADFPVNLIKTVNCYYQNSCRIIVYIVDAFSALMLLVGRQEGILSGTGSPR